LIYILLTTADQFLERNYKVKGYYINQCVKHIQEYFVLVTILILICLNKRENRTVRCTLKKQVFVFYKYWRYAVPVDLLENGTLYKWSK